MKRIVSFMGAALILVGLVSPTLDVPRAPVAHAEPQVRKVDVQTEVQQPKEEVAPVEPEPSPASAPVVVPQDNETISWNFFISQGFTREQTAGIMGNLKQEHNFRTDGDGIAQWLGNRKANLYAKADPTSIHTQLAFIMEELGAGEAGTHSLLRAATTVEDATIIFQNKYERCNPVYCMQSQRIAYAYDIMGRH